jgi:N-acetylglutamate synthase-like GNAT family acetyltransferase/DNA-binding MarR family transcriptional regulator
MDILRDYGAVFLGSRLKRLGERMQAGAAKVITDAGLPVQPSHMPLLAALDQQPMTIGQLAQAVGVSQPGVTRAAAQLVELGLAHSTTGDDQRLRTISLAPAGAAAMARARLKVFPQVGAAVDTLLRDRLDAFMTQLAELETALDATPIDVAAAQSQPSLLTLREYSDDLAPYFHDINAEWITDMFQLEATDREVLEQPRARIIDKGGVILFVEAKGLGIVGTCALQKTGEHSFELTKMGVRASARGLKVGEFLLRAMITRALQLGAEPLYLLTNTKCAAGIHLYEKAGFQHDADIMARYGARYARCNVAMRYVPSQPVAG